LSIAQKINSSNSFKKLKSQAMLFDDKNMLNWLINSDACVAIVPYSLCSKYLKIDPRLSLVFPSQGVPLMWHFLLSRSNLNSAILIQWIKSLENKSIVDKLVSQGWYLPFNSDYLQSKYKSVMFPTSGPSEKCWQNSWSFPVLTNEQKINLENIWNESLSP
jgi:spermidine/putrescine-binding protein